MSRLLIIGAGGHGKVVADAALAAGWRDVAFLDDRCSDLGSPLGLAVLGKTEDLPRQSKSFDGAVVAVGNAVSRLELLQGCRDSGLNVVSIVHPAACVSRFATVGSGSVIFAGSAVNADAVLEDGCIINTGATVDHDCMLRRGVHVCPGAHLAGGVAVGERSWIGIGAVVRQGINIGRDVIVGAGAAVIADVPDGVTVMGVPARPRRV